MPVSKEASLTALYRRMDRDEIEHRLAAGDLAELAATAARQELERRDRAAALERAKSPREVALSIVGGAVITGALAYWIMPREIFWLIAVSFLPGLAMALGKALPAFGRFAGGILIATPLWLGAWMQHAGNLKWQGGDYRPLGTLLAWGILIALSFFGVLVGGNMLRGARHTGSWQELRKEVEKEREEKMEGIRRLD